MIQTVFKSTTYFLIQEGWDLNTLQATFTLARDTQDSLTSRETRRAYAATLLTALKFSTTPQAATLRQLQGSLRNLNTQPVIVPFWPGLTNWSDRATAPISGGLRIAFKADWSQFQIYAATDAEPTWPAADDYFAPALMGFINPTAPEWITPDAVKWSVDFTESSPAAYALAPAASAFTSGPTPTGYTTAPYLLPFNPDFQQVNEEISVAVTREQIGFDREQRQEFYPQSPSRKQNASYTLQGSDIGKLLYFFQTVAAPGASFWASGFMNVATLTGDIAPSDTVLNVADTSALFIGDYISISYGGLSIARKITVLTGNTVTLDAAVGSAFDASQTCIFPLCLVAMPKPSLTVNWASVTCAHVNLQWQELPDEMLLPVDETLGSTLGKLPQRIIFYQFTRDYGNGTVNNWYFVGYESDVTWSGQLYTHARFECGIIPQSLNAADDETQITSDIFTGNPLVDEAALTSEAPLQVKVTTADFDGVNVTNTQQVFFGLVASAPIKGGQITAKCKLGSGLTQTSLPRMISGEICNHLAGSNDGTFLFSYGCTLLKSNWKFTGQIGSPLSAAFPYALKVTSLTGVGANASAALAAGQIFANWFANGWIEWGAGANIQRRFIGGSTAPSGGALTLTLHRWFTGTGPNIGDTVTFYPGCDGLYTTCQAYNASTNPTGKFNNYVNFGAEPFMPISNPSLTGLTQNGTQGGKK